MNKFTSLKDLMKHLLSGGKVKTKGMDLVVHLDTFGQMSVRTLTGEPSSFCPTLEAYPDFEKYSDPPVQVLVATYAYLTKTNDHWMRTSAFFENDADFKKRYTYVLKFKRLDEITVDRADPSKKYLPKNKKTDLMADDDLDIAGLGD